MRPSIESNFHRNKHVGHVRCSRTLEVLLYFESITLGRRHTWAMSKSKIPKQFFRSFPLMKANQSIALKCLIPSLPHGNRLERGGFRTFMI